MGGTIVDNRARLGVAPRRASNARRKGIIKRANSVYSRYATQETRRRSRQRKLLRAQLKRYAGTDVAAQAGNRPTRTNRSQLTRFTYVVQTATRRPEIREVLRPPEYPDSIE